MPGNSIDNIHVPLFDPACWQNMDQIHAIFAQMRRDSPVHRGSCAGFPDLWHATRHADIFEIERNSAAFLNAPRLIIMESAREEAVRRMTGGSTDLVQSLVSMDNPMHSKMRRLTQSFFMPKNLRSLQDSIDASTALGVETLLVADGPIDFAQDVALEFPLRVIMALLGIPKNDYGLMLKLTQELFGPDDPDTQRRDVTNERSKAEALQKTYAEFAAYFSDVTADRRANPKEDLASIIANATIDGRPISDREALGYFIIIATAGHDTTSYSLTEAVRQLATDPILFARFKSDPETIAPKIVEEAIRFASPVRHFIRTADTDYELRGRRIAAGDSIVLWYPSGSRDEGVFEKPDRFDIDRPTSPQHASFGHGAHLCLGMHLARQEIRTFLIALVNRVSSMALLEEPRYLRSNFVGGIKSLSLSLKVETQVCK